MKNNYLKLFTNCKIVKGATRSIVCDLQRGKYVLIPNSLATLFDQNGEIDLELIKKELDEESLVVLDEYIELLNSHEFVFNCSKKEALNFPPLSIEFDYPATISNAIIDFDKNTAHDLKLIIEDFLIPTNCRYLQIRCFDEVDLTFLDIIINEVNNSFIKSIDLVIKISDNLPNSKLTKWVSDNKKVRSLAIHSSLENKIIQEEERGFGVVVTLQQKINSNNHCGIIHYNLFNVNIETFTESQNYNSCLNRKISIDINGNVKNCPSMLESFGNIKNTKLKDVLNNPNFKKYWNITKDQVYVCKDCEFRHVCTDCRAYIENTEDLYSKPLKCGYNPYTNKWEEWSTNPLKQKKNAFYNMQELIKT